jgi:ParB family chromosome partitioning protein
MVDNSKRQRGLGRGLSALMADVGASSANPSTSGTNSSRPDRSIPIERVFPNPDQPRRHFAEDQLQDLANSIKTKGIIQPLIVRSRPGHEGDYEIVAGERRWRAAQIARLHQVPVVVREFTDIEVLEIAIIENIQRADLNPVEEAMGYRQLMDRFGHTQEKLAEALGKSRSYIANLLRLLSLPDEVLDMLKDGQLSIGHARALITSDQPIDLARKVVAGGLSVRETEKLVKQAAQGESTPKAKSQQPGSSIAKDADTLALEGDLSAALRLRVSVDHVAGSESGKITLHYTTLDQLDDLCRILTATN